MNDQIEVLCNVSMKCGINRMNIETFTQHVGWLGGKRVELHLWDLGIKLHK
jgi:hypothetical protein